MIELDPWLLSPVVGVVGSGVNPTKWFFGFPGTGHGDILKANAKEFEVHYSNDSLIFGFLYEPTGKFYDYSSLRVRRLDSKLERHLTSEDLPAWRAKENFHEIPIVVSTESEGTYLDATGS